MFRFRLLVVAILVLAVPVQAFAAVSPQSACFEHAAGVATSLAMDCHANQASDSSEAPSCCGDACPDMTACVAAHAVSATPSTSAAGARAATNEIFYLLPAVTTRLSSPFRPPTNSIV